MANEYEGMSIQSKGGEREKKSIMVRGLKMRVECLNSGGGGGIMPDVDEGGSSVGKSS